MRLDKQLRAIGLTPLRVDPCIYCKFGKTESLICIVSTHVDDLKCAGLPRELELLGTGLTKVFGTLKAQRGSFEHCGISHIQAKDGSIILSQDKYVKQLQRVEITKKQKDTPEEACDTDLHSKYRTLLEGFRGYVKLEEIYPSLLALSNV